jgi:hypothetical protein
MADAKKRRESEIDDDFMPEKSPKSAKKANKADQDVQAEDEGTPSRRSGRVRKQSHIVREMMAEEDDIIENARDEDDDEVFNYF